MNKRSFEIEEKDCADMLGMTLEEYKESLKKLKIPKFKDKVSDDKKNNILYKLGLNETYLKKMA